MTCLGLLGSCPTCNTICHGKFIQGKCSLLSLKDCLTESFTDFTALRAQHPSSLKAEKRTIEKDTPPCHTVLVLIPSFNFFGFDNATCSSEQIVQGESLIFCHAGAACSEGAR